LFFTFIAASLLLVSCGGNSGSSSGAVPEVVVEPGTNPIDGNTDSGGNTVNNPADSTLPSVTIKPTDGYLTVNGENVPPSDYNSSNQSATVIAVDEHGVNCVVTVSNDGNIIITPDDGSAEGTYTVTINTGDREYVIIIEVNANGDPVVSTCISYPSGSSMILDLNDGKFVNTLNGNTITVTDDGLFPGFALVADIQVTGPGGSTVSVTVDPLTGDIIASGDMSGPYTIVITTSDGSVITLTTDNNGKITAVIENNSTLILNLDNGSVSSSGYNLSLTVSSGTGIWSLADGVQVLSVTAAGGAIQQIDTARLWINQINGDIMIAGSNGLEPPVGPYEIKVSAGNSVYVIKTDTNGQVVSILPGNVLLQLSQGVIIYSGNNVLAIANNSNGWTLSGAITGLTAVDASGRGLNIIIDPVSGNLVTDANVTGTVTITFVYTDSQGNGITYTITVINGSVNSYTAEITNPSSDFDFSTVTNIKVFLNVVDGTTGLPVKQASISLANATADSWKGFTDDLGISIFTATVASASQTTSIAVAHAGYKNIQSPITGIGKLIEIGKKIAMTPETLVIPPVDSDGDGVADSEDDYPYDSTGAKTITGVYTLAFEDLYPSKGDADFNDLVVRLTITEKIDSQNKLRQINLKTKLMASGAGYKNQFGININGVRRILISNPKAVSIYTLGYYDKYGQLKYYSNTSGTYRDCAELSHSPILFEGGISRESVGAMPYDPFIICNGVAGNEVHLPSVETSFTGMTKDTDGFTWALLVPETWKWPKESASVYNAYPYFQNWYTSFGENNSDWYMTYSSSYVYTY
jgi:hypothetical protein